MSLQSPEMTITVELRPGRGTVEAGRMRRGGRVPAVFAAVPTLAGTGTPQGVRDVPAALMTPMAVPLL